MLNALLIVLAFIRWMSNLSSLKIFNHIETDNLYRKEDDFPEVVHLDAENAILTALLKIFRQNPKYTVQGEKTISRIKSFELKTISSRRVSRANGGVEVPINKIGYSERTWAESGEGTSTLAENSRVT